MSRTREPCGCVHDGHKWLSMCDAHLTEFNATHQRWSEEHFGRAKVVDEQPQQQEVQPCR